MKRVLVTGATGFIGTVLTRHLHNCNYYVVGMSRRPNKVHNEYMSVDEWVQHDICDDAVNLEQILKNIDYVVHLAGNAHEDRQLPYADYDLINNKSTEKLILKASEKSVEKFVFVSTVKVNGESTNSGHAFSEVSTPDPRDSYSRSKYEAEKRLRDICNGSSMQYVILRPPLVFGAGVKANFLSMMRIVKSGIPLPFASVHNVRSFIYIENLTDVIEKCLNTNKVNNELYLIKDISLSLPDLIKKLSQELESRTLLLPCPSGILYLLGSLTGKKTSIQKLISSLEVDDKKIRSDLDWRPNIGFDDSIKATVDWYEGRGKLGGS